MADELAALVTAESPSGDPAALAGCAAVISELFIAALGRAPEPVTVDGTTHLRWAGGGGRTPTSVAVVGHFDTVWPLGITGRWPFRVEGSRATGPGAFDMKAGIVQLIEALATLDDHEGVTVVLTADEETGSRTSRALVEGTARGAAAALILEPSAGGALKGARKGTGMYTVRVHGRASHAGLEPEKGRNALLGLVSVLGEVARIGDDALGTTVTPTMAAAGTATNVVPAEASAEIDVRLWVPTEAERVDAALRALRSAVPGTTLTVEGGPTRPPLPESASAELFARAQRCAGRLGLAALRSVSVGGGSDGNLTAAVGTPTLDGLGAVGDGAHAEGEYVELPAMAERAALVAELVADVLAAGS